MPYVATCTFREPAKTYYLDPGELDLGAQTRVIAETSRGLEIGSVKFRPREVSETAVAGPLAPVNVLALTVRIAVAREKQERTFGCRH